VPHVVDPQDVDVGGQELVDAATQRFGRQRGVNVEVGDLGEGVDAGVGPAGAVEFEFSRAGSLANGAVDLALHRPRVLLDLPAAIAGSRVFDRQLEAHHLVSGINSALCVCSRRLPDPTHEPTRSQTPPYWSRSSA
jgi:hypothetical protein